MRVHPRVRTLAIAATAATIVPSTDLASSIGQRGGDQSSLIAGARRLV